MAEEMQNNIRNNITNCIENVLAKDDKDNQTYFIKQCVNRYIKNVNVNIKIHNTYPTYSGSSSNHSCSKDASGHSRDANGFSWDGSVAGHCII